MSVCPLCGNKEETHVFWVQLKQGKNGRMLGPTEV
jgi:hypothetical protein